MLCLYFFLLCIFLNLRWPFSLLCCRLCIFSNYFHLFFFVCFWLRNNLCRLNNWFDMLWNWFSYFSCLYFGLFFCLCWFNLFTRLFWLLHLFRILLRLLFFCLYFLGLYFFGLFFLNQNRFICIIDNRHIFFNFTRLRNLFIWCLVFYTLSFFNCLFLFCKRKIWNRTCSSFLSIVLDLFLSLKLFNLLFEPFK